MKLVSIKELYYDARPTKSQKPLVIRDNSSKFAVGWHGHSGCTAPVTSLLPTAGDENVCV